MKILGICLGIFALLIFLILMIRVRVFVSFDAEGFKTKLKILFYALDLPPKRQEKQAKPDEKKKKKIKKNGKLSDFTNIVTSAISVAPQAIRSIRIDDLKADVTVASDDACKTAMLYGSLAAGCGIILPVLENNFKIRKKKIYVNADFEASEMGLLLDAAFSIAVWQIVWIALCFLKIFLCKKRNSIQTKGMNDNGRTCAQ